MVALALCLLSSIALAADGRHAGQWIARAGVGGVFPDSDNLTVPGVGTIEADEAYALTLTGAYMITDSVSVELLASSFWTHDVNLKGVGQIGEVKQLPPTLSLQWHTPAIGRLHPYLGVGVNWTIFFDEETQGPIAGTKLSVGNSVGIAAQVAADFDINDKWLLNADLRWINIESDVKLDGLKLGTATIDPWVFSVNVGYKF